MKNQEKESVVESARSVSVTNDDEDKSQGKGEPSEKPQTEFEEFVEVIKTDLLADQISSTSFSKILGAFFKLRAEPGALSLENGLTIGEFLPEAFRKLGKMDKKMERFATNAQDILWKYFDYERLSKENKESLFVRARSVWMELEEWAETGKVVRALIFTLQYCPISEMKTITSRFKKVIDRQSSTPGFGRILVDHLLAVADPKMPIPCFNNVTLNLKAEKICRESFKELKACILAAKYHLYTPPGRTAIQQSSARKKESLTFLTKLIEHIISHTPNVEQWYLSGEIQPCVSSLANQYKKYLDGCSGDSSYITALTDIYLGKRIISICVRLISELNPTSMTVNQTGCHMFLIFVVQKWFEYLTQTKLHEKEKSSIGNHIEDIIPDLAILFTKAFTHLKFRAQQLKPLEVTEKIHPNTGQKTTWGVLTDSLIVIFSGCKKCNISSKLLVRSISLKMEPETSSADETVISSIIWDLIYSISNSITTSDEDNNLFDYLGLDLKLKSLTSQSKRQIKKTIWLISAIWETFTEVLMEQGIYQDTQTMKFIRNTFLKVHSLQSTLNEIPIDSVSLTKGQLDSIIYYKQLGIEPDLIQIVTLQIKSVDASIAKPIEEQFSKTFEENQNNLVYQVWSNLIPWHQDVTNAWKKGDEKASLPRLNVNALTSINVDLDPAVYNEMIPATRQMYLQSAFILGEFLLMIGKRQNGLKILCQLYFIALQAMDIDGEDMLASPEIISQLGLEIVQAAWLDSNSNLIQPMRMLKITNNLLENEYILSDFEKDSLVYRNLLLTRSLLSSMITQEDPSQKYPLPEFVFEKMSGSAEDFYCHSIGKVATVAAEGINTHAANLRYCIQIHASLMSTMTERSFYQNLFSTNMPSSGSLKMPTFGRDMLHVLCNAEKIFWYSERLISEFMQRGFTVEVRQFANEMVATAEVWGLQLPYLIGKRYQVEALNMEGQSKSCHEEAQALSEALRLDSKFSRDINPMAKAEAIVLEAVRRSSSTMSQSEEPEGIEKPPEETEFKLISTIKNICTGASAVDVGSPTAAVMKDKKKNCDKKNKYFLKIPKLSKVDPDTSKAIVSCMNVLFRIQSNDDDSLQSCLRMLRELESHNPTSNLCSLYDTMNVILERKLNLPLKEFEIEIDTALQMFEKKSPRETKFPEMARFYLNKVLYADYKRQHSIDIIKQELIPSLNKIKIEQTGDSFKTPARPKRTDKLTGRLAAMSGATATPKSVKVPKSSRLGGLKKPKIEVFSEDLSLPKPKLVLDDTPAKSSRKRDGQKGAKTRRKAVEADGDYETPGRAPINPKETRMRTRNARKNELNAMGNDEDFETDRGLIKAEGDSVFLSPIQASDASESLEEKRNMVTRLGGNSRPTSPLIPVRAHVDQIPGGSDSQIPPFGIESNASLLDLAYKTALANGSMETARAAVWSKMNNMIEILRKTGPSNQKSFCVFDHDSENGQTAALVTTSQSLAELHQTSVGIGAIMDTEYSCRSRLSNTVSPPSGQNDISYSKEMLKWVTDRSIKPEVSDPAVLISLVPMTTSTLTCSYKNCQLVVTRIDPKHSMTVVVDGNQMATCCKDMDNLVEKISIHLGTVTTDGDPKSWWADRRLRNNEIIDLQQNRIPDAMYLALPLLVFPKTVNYQSLKNIDGFRSPSNRCEQLYLAYAVRAWDLIGNKKAAIRTQVSIADHFSKYDRDQKFFKEFGKAMKSHSWSSYDWQRKSQTFLILSRLVQQCPIERLMVLEMHRVSRLPSMAHYGYLTKRAKEDKTDERADISNGFYMIDNQGNLESTASTMTPFFSKIPEWKGFSGSGNPKSDVMTQELNRRSLYVFCGHGSGSDAVGGWGRMIRKGIKSHCHLIGCSSGRLRENGRTEPRGTPLKVLDSGAPSCLSLLWSVTDRDIDRYTLRLYADWFSGERQSGEPGPNLGRYIVESEKACKLGPLNGGAVVNYGLLPNCIRVPQNWDTGLPKDINYHPEAMVKS